MGTKNSRNPGETRRAIRPVVVGLLVAIGVVGAVAPGRAAEPVPCLGGSDARSMAFRKEAQATAIFAYARSLLGTPTACRITWNSFDGADFGAIAFRFKDGSRLTYERQPPEVTIIGLMAARPLELERAKRVLEKESGQGVDWSQTPEVRREPHGEVRTYWHPEEGLNLGVDLVYRAGRLRGIGYHAAP